MICYMRRGVCNIEIIYGSYAKNEKAAKPLFCVLSIRVKVGDHIHDLLAHDGGGLVNDRLFAFKNIVLAVLADESVPFKHLWGARCRPGIGAVYAADRFKEGTPVIDIQIAS